MSGPSSRTLGVENLVDARRFVPSDVRKTESGDIEWRGSELELLSDAGPAAGALRAFIGLADELEPDAFVEFARRWGVLGLCRHGATRFHEGCDAFNPLGGLQLPSIEVTEWRSEPLGGWRAKARELRSFLRLSMQLQRNLPGAESDWATVIGHISGAPIPFPSVASTIDDRRSGLASSLSDRIREAGIVPAMGWDPKQPTPSFYLRLGQEAPTYIPDALYAVLVAQLVASMGVAIPECSNCGEPCATGPTERLLRTDRRVFCSNRCRDIVERDRKRIWAAKRRASEPTVP